MNLYIKTSILLSLAASTVVLQAFEIGSFFLIDLTDDLESPVVADTIKVDKSLFTQPTTEDSDSISELSSDLFKDDKSTQESEAAPKISMGKDDFDIEPTKSSFESDFSFSTEDSSSSFGF